MITTEPVIKKTVFNSARTFIFSDDGIEWSKPQKLLYVEADTLYPWADENSTQWKHIK